MADRSSSQKLAAIRADQFKKLVEENKTYPLATITYHGVSPDKASKIIVGIIKSQDQIPLVQEWEGEDIGEDVKAAREIALYIKEHEVARVITSEWVLSCPHEEGLDYPAGENCPHCPDWH